MSQQNVEGDFPEEGEEEAEGEDDESVAPSFLRYNPDIEVEIRFEELYLQEIQITLEQPLQQVLGSTIDVSKKTFVDHLYYVCKLLLIEEALSAYDVDSQQGVLGACFFRQHGRGGAEPIPRKNPLNQVLLQDVIESRYHPHFVW